jgi:hypothetical protein
LGCATLSPTYSQTYNPNPWVARYSMTSYTAKYTSYTPDIWDKLLKGRRFLRRVRTSRRAELSCATLSERDSDRMGAAWQRNGAARQWPPQTEVRRGPQCQSIGVSLSSADPALHLVARGRDESAPASFSSPEDSSARKVSAKKLAYPGGVSTYFSPFSPTPLSNAVGLSRPEGVRAPAAGVPVAGSSCAAQPPPSGFCGKRGAHVPPTPALLTWALALALFGSPPSPAATPR